MATPSPLDDAVAALEKCQGALERLEATCCLPGRSPRMQELGSTIDRARHQITRTAEDAEAGDAAIGIMENAGAQVGTLQVGCCAPNRMPLYTTILENLMTAQIAVNRSLDRGH